MRLLRSRSMGLALTLSASMLSTLLFGFALAQDKPRAADDPKAAKEKGKDSKDAKTAKDAKSKKKGPAVAGGAPPKKNRPNAVDPLLKKGAQAPANAANANPNAKAAAANPQAPLAEPVWPFYYKLRISGGDGAPIAASYYPPRSRMNAPVILLIHDRGPGRSGKDWQEPLEELKAISLAESLQEQGYAVLVPDLRGHGANPRKELTPTEWRALPADIQAMYLFLVDRHNRGDINLAKFGVIAMGDGANLVTAWTSLPGAATTEGRTSDLSAMILISPIEDANGLKFMPTIGAIASKLPIYLLCGDRDAASIKVVKDAQPVVERNQQSKVTYFDTPLHGYRLLHFFPKVPGSVTKFLENPVKARILEWEPRYLLTPVTYEGDGMFESKTSAKAAEAAKKAEPAKKKDAN